MARQWKNKQVLVLGLARSGTEAAHFLLDAGARVTVNDRTPFNENAAAGELQERGAEVVCGHHPESLIHRKLDAVIKNPGIRYDHPLVQKAVDMHIPVFTEIQLAYDTSRAPIIGITGSNGKTTTTTYVTQMLEGSRRHPIPAGNIGIPACRAARDASLDDILVMELSSFQLMGIDTFRPQIAVLLNVIDAHLDYHGSREGYELAKQQITVNQEPEDYFVYNADDPVVSNMAARSAARTVPFSLEQELPHGLCLKEGWMMAFDQPLLPLEDFPLPGLYNAANALAAAGAALLAGASREKTINVLKTFRGVEHRMQSVGEYNGVKFYNNSKATNIPAAVTSLEAFQEPVHLLCGGLDRGNGFDELVPSLGRVKSAAGFGETGSAIMASAEEAGVSHTKVTETLQEGFAYIMSHAEPGDVVLLSPACASWDQYPTFEARGDDFIRTVEEWKTAGEDRS
ncbi:UDP-N-acetylmuramoyl-L-alanine--D-glutamate ligase [Alkalicoccus chagannorensis]|uniref:UDP-N-acetylmuramoyl-L-alanine--D-glutamate ligase n=1 Tax=Alkalicoccus chagannorensis TaxID=427072 RepID=UPI00040B8C6B|nr:UDP-N-acetylmuramoyl-L-alanine--D-glutamate ligase [Alkalicoccus chagannorensis]